MKTKLLLLTAVVASAMAGNALSMNKDEYKTQKDRISSEYKANRDKCSSLKANAKDICVSQAKGSEKVAKAELEAQYKPDAKQDLKVRMAKADAAYDTAKEKCDDLTGNTKDVCVKDAKVAHVKAKEDAKVAKVSADTSGNRSDKVNAAKKDANEEKREAEYKAVKERCDSLSGAAKDNCQNDAKVKFGMK